MPGKDKFSRRIDKAAAFTGGGAVETTTPNYAPPAIKTIPVPDDLVLGSFIGQSSAAPTAGITAEWSRPSGSVPQEYRIQVSESNTFPDGETTTYTALTESATMDGLKPATLYYVRVAAVFRRIQSGWSDTASETTPNDTTPASAPTSPAAAWIGVGDLRITWVNPTEENFKWVHVRVRASSGGTILREFESRAGVWVYRLAENLADTGGVGDSSLYVEMYSVTYSNVNSSTVNTGLITKAVPATPAGFAQSWTGDAGLAGPDLTLSWTAANDAFAYRLTLNGVARQFAGNRYTYSLDANRAENSGTPDPSITYSLVAVDGFGQVSTAVSGTATNAAPATPTATLEQGAVSGLHATVTSTPPADFLAYEFVFKRESTTVATVVTPQASAAYPMQGANDQGYHSWTVVIRQKDVFGQFSATVTPAAVAFEALTLAGLRAGAEYTDSDGNNAATLAFLKDGSLTTTWVGYNA
jgi:hypothetical protein